MKEFHVNLFLSNSSFRVSIFIHITENFFHLSVANGFMEVDRLDARRVDESKQRQHQQQPPEASNLRWKLGATVLSEHHLVERQRDVHYRQITIHAFTCQLPAPGPAGSQSALHPSSLSPPNETAQSLSSRQTLRDPQLST
jgi:hypothetical protein